MTRRAIQLGGAAIASMLFGCYDPVFRAGIECGVGSSCPSDQVCGRDNVCYSRDELPQPPGEELSDAAPVECSTDDECQSPPNRCWLEGTCNREIGLCQFPNKDCSSLDGDCTRGACRPSDGECIAEAANDGTSCGDATVTGCGSCGEFDGTCDESGTMSCTCTSFSCSSGFCTPTTASCAQACSRDTDGTTCNTMQVTGCGTCSFADLCTTAGTATCTCTSFSCTSGACTGNGVSCAQGCTRPSTDGDLCGIETESCDECPNPDCVRSCTCTTPACAAGSCSDVSTRPCGFEPCGGFCQPQ